MSGYEDGPAGSETGSERVALAPWLREYRDELDERVQAQRQIVRQLQRSFSEGVGDELSEQEKLALVAQGAKRQAALDAYLNAVQDLAKGSAGENQE